MYIVFLLSCWAHHVRVCLAIRSSLRRRPARLKREEEEKKRGEKKCKKNWSVCLLLIASRPKTGRNLPLYPAPNRCVKILEDARSTAPLTRWLKGRSPLKGSSALASIIVERGSFKSDVVYSYDDDDKIDTNTERGHTLLSSSFPNERQMNFTWPKQKKTLR